MDWKLSSTSASLHLTTPSPPCPPYIHTHIIFPPATRLRAPFVYTLAAAAALYATLNALLASLAARSIACIHLLLLYDSRVSSQQCF
ncbi:hypothetical protein K466DRAFT_277951 [Polyporus arcularius HHB13444]|uniref:Uncharacterized protein n=1 Tax=Polyporus arcularius HHB13444 TaxID=1314778 RepID=A0A5C3PR25_9APHY|nr:hypothetical protein K466DRAFT_277951 [Polyporus arcularius HHB13444]